MINLINHNTLTLDSRYHYKLPWTNYIKVIPAYCDNPNEVLFLSNELLIQREELNLLSLQGYFINMLKAMHLCWLIVRNNQRLVFISDQSQQQTHGLATSLAKDLTRRDSLPELMIRHRFKHKRRILKIKRLKGKRAYRGLHKLVRAAKLNKLLYTITSRSKYKDKYKYKQIKIPRMSRSKSYYLKFKLLMTYVFSRQSYYACFARKPGYIGNTIPPAISNNHYLTCSKTKHKRINIIPDTNFIKDRYTDLDFKVLHRKRRRWTYHQYKWFIRYLISRSRVQMCDVDDMTEPDSHWYMEDMRDRVSVLPEKIAKSHYDRLLASTNNNVKKTQAKNWILRDADVIWFLNPEWNLNLVYQAKHYNIPTIGLVAGNPIRQTRIWQKYNMDQLIDYCIAGNPESWFVSINMISLTLRLMQHAFKIGK